MSWPAAWTPFLTTDQNGSLAWPWLTTMMRVLPCCAVAGAAAASVRAAAAARPVTNDFIGFLPVSLSSTGAGSTRSGSRRGQAASD